MKKIVLLLCTLIIGCSNLISQPVQDSVYYERLYYLCKVWGHAKYYHTEIANGSINWDDELLRAINGAKYAPTNEAFNDSLLVMLNNAGEMGTSIVPLPEVPDSLNNNSDLGWIQDSFFSDTVRSMLDTIMARFRPQSNVYVDEAWPGSYPKFDNDNLYYYSPQYPSEELRILALFRYWNIINYFFPYKYMIDQDWGSTLIEFIPLIVDASDALDYHLKIKQLLVRLDDGHAYMNSQTYSYWKGPSYPPFYVQNIENEVVVTKVISNVTEVNVGDVVREIDGIEINSYQDSMRNYTNGSNPFMIEHNINEMILWGDNGNFEVVLDDGVSIRTETLKRDGSNYFDLNQGLNNNYFWKDTIINDSCKFGMVNMAMISFYNAEDMMNELWDVNAIIFDLRISAGSGLWQIVNYIYTDPLHISNFGTPDIMYPGRLYWDYNTIGDGTTDPYQGNIIILINERTFSRGEYTCMGFEQFPGAIKIGSTTAGGDGDATPIYLPGNITVYMTALGVYYPDYRETQRVGISPHYEVRPTISGLRQGEDEVMNFALNCALFGVDEYHQALNIKAFPNPFTTTTTIEYELSEPSHINLTIYSLMGQVIEEAFDGVLSPGSHSYTWTPINLPQGMYYAVMRSEDGVSVVKMVKQ